MTLTGLYQDRALDVVKQTHRQDGAATLHFPTGDPLDIILRDPQITFSEDWSPYMQLTADAVTPADAETLVRIDPRNVGAGAVLEVRAGYVYDDGTADVQTLALGHLRSRRALLPEGTMPVTAASAEQLAQDTKWLLATTTKVFGGVLEALEYLTTYATGKNTAGTFISTINPVHRPDLVSGVVLEQGEDLWGPISAIALSAGLRVWADENDVWNLAPKTTIAGVTSAFLKQGPATTVSKVEDVLSRENWFNAAALVYTWKDSGGVEQKIVGTWSPDPAPGTEKGAGCKTFTDDRPGPISQYQANENARLTVKNLSTRGGSYVVESVAMFWLRPGMTVQIDLANGVTVRHIVRRVTFNVGAGSMILTTREPSNLGD